MAAIEREKFTSQVTPDLLIKMREIARNDGRPFQTVVEDAFRQYIESRSQKKVSPEVMAHFWASVEKNRRLGELLAQ